MKQFLNTTSGCDKMDKQEMKSQAVNISDEVYNSH